MAKAYTDDITIIHALELRDFLLMDTLVDCFYDYRRVPLGTLRRPVIDESINIRLATSKDCDKLVAVTGNAFHAHFGRFHADERIGRDLATKIYEQWMRSSSNGYADHIYLASVKEEIVGFSVWKLPSNEEKRLNVRVGHYSIAGIHPDFYGHGLFTALTYAGMQSFDGCVDIIEGPTHINNYGYRGVI